MQNGAQYMLRNESEDSCCNCAKLQLKKKKKKIIYAIVQSAKNGDCQINPHNISFTLLHSGWSQLH